MLQLNDNLLQTNLRWFYSNFYLLWEIEICLMNNWQLDNELSIFLWWSVKFSDQLLLLLLLLGHRVCPIAQVPGAKLLIKLNELPQRALTKTIQNEHPQRALTTSTHNEHPQRASTTSTHNEHPQRLEVDFTYFVITILPGLTVNNNLQILRNIR